MKRYSVVVTFDVYAETAGAAHDLVNEDLMRCDCDGVIVSSDVVQYDGAWLPEEMRAPLGALLFGDVAGRRFVVVTDSGVFASDGRAAYRMASPPANVEQHPDVHVRDTQLPRAKSEAPCEGAPEFGVAKWGDHELQVPRDVVRFGGVIVAIGYFEAARAIFAERGTWHALTMQSAHPDALELRDGDVVLATIMGMRQESVSFTPRAEPQAAAS